MERVTFGVAEAEERNGSALGLIYPSLRKRKTRHAIAFCNAMLGIVEMALKEGGIRGSRITERAMMLPPTVALRDVVGRLST